MAEIRLTFDASEFGRLARLFAASDPLFRKAVNAALRRAGGRMRSRIGRGIKSKSYLTGKDATGAIGRLKVNEAQASILVAADNKAAHKFKLSPNEITARKGRRSVSWPSPSVLKGPGLSPINPKLAGFSKPFIAKRNSLTAMYVRERHTGKLFMPRIASPQYFAAFEKVAGPVLEQAGQTFLKRIAHEIDYRLGALQ